MSEMEHRQLGRSGLTVSTLGLGCNNFGRSIDAEQSAAVVHRALDEGITFFDTADIYGDSQSEEFLGAALRTRRDEAIVATKFGLGVAKDDARGSRRNIVRACEASLRRLGTDHIDLYYLHVPDPITPMEETLDALADLVHQGKVRYLASSNLLGWQIVDADHLARQPGRHPFVACQLQWNLLARAAERDMVPACRHAGVGVVTYFPLASGLLTGKYRRDEPFPAGSRLAVSDRFAAVATPENFDRVERLETVAAASGRTLLDLAICWLLTQDGVSSVLTGATTPEQVAANVAAGTWRLDADELAAVEDALAPPSPAS